MLAAWLLTPYFLNKLFLTLWWKNFLLLLLYYMLRSCDRIQLTATLVIEYLPYSQANFARLQNSWMCRDAFSVLIQNVILIILFRSSKLSKFFSFSVRDLLHPPVAQRFTRRFLRFALRNQVFHWPIKMLKSEWRHNKRQFTMHCVSTKPTKKPNMSGSGRWTNQIASF